MKLSEAKVLIVDEVQESREALLQQLSPLVKACWGCTNSEEAMKICIEHCPHLVLMDISLSGIDGTELCMDIRENLKIPELAIAFITDRKENYSIIAGYEAGADDYIVKPVHPKLLQRRLSALLKRFNSYQTSQVIEFDDWAVDIHGHRVITKKGANDLVKKEFELLMLLCKEPGHIYSRDEILQQIWQDAASNSSRIVDAHIKKLRRIIGDRKIKTVRGVGYQIKAN